MSEEADKAIDKGASITDYFNHFMEKNIPPEKGLPIILTHVDSLPEAEKEAVLNATQFKEDKVYEFAKAVGGDKSKPEFEDYKALEAAGKHVYTGLHDTFFGQEHPLRKEMRALEEKLENEKKGLQKKLEDINFELTDTEVELNDLQKEYETLDEERKELEGDYKGLKEKKEQLDKNYTAAEKTIKSKERRIKKIEAEKADISRLFENLEKTTGDTIMDLTLEAEKRDEALTAKNKQITEYGISENKFTSEIEVLKSNLIIKDKELKGINDQYKTEHKEYLATQEELEKSNTANMNLREKLNGLEEEVSKHKRKLKIIKTKEIEKTEVSAEESDEPLKELEEFVVDKEEEE
jgi:chromosome segregation ATPase